MLRTKSALRKLVSPLRRRSLLLAVLTLPLALGFAIPGGSAHAATVHVYPETSYTHDYSKAWTFVSTELQKCVYFEVEGSIQYTETVSGAPHASIFTYTGIHVDNPVMTAQVEQLVDGKSCSGSTTATSMAIQQAWAGYSCSFNPTISVAVPFSLSVSGWPSCSSRNQAKDSTSYSTKATGYTQANSGNKITYGTYQVSGTDTAPCYAVRINGTIYEGSTSDTYVSGADSVCL